MPNFQMGRTRQPGCGCMSCVSVQVDILREKALKTNHLDS